MSVARADFGSELTTVNLSSDECGMLSVLRRDFNGWNPRFQAGMASLQGNFY